MYTYWGSSLLTTNEIACDLVLMIVFFPVSRNSSVPGEIYLQYHINYFKVQPFLLPILKKSGYHTGDLYANQ